MPEIWLNYGAADVVLDIKVENLNAYDNPNFSKLDDLELTKKLESVPLQDSNIFALDSSRSVSKIILSLTSLARQSGINNITVQCLQKDYMSLSRKLDNVTLSVSRQSPSHLVQIGNDHRTVFIATTRADPLFGFEGLPTVILRTFFKDKMTEAYNARTSNLPCPSVKSSPLQVAIETCKDMSANCLHVISSNDSIDSLFYGQIVESFEKSIDRMRSLAQSDYANIRSMIISSDKNFDSYLNLSESLRYLWNCIHVLKNNGLGILLAENRSGLGADALRKFAEGKLTSDYTGNDVEYVDGVEHLLFMDEVKRKYQIGILSSLPHYYLNSKFGLQTFSRTQDILNKIFEVCGRAHKILVISDPNQALFKYPIL